MCREITFATSRSAALLLLIGIFQKILGKWINLMDNTDLTDIWKELRAMREAMFQVQVYVEGLQRTLDASTSAFQEQRLQHEKDAADLYRQVHAATIHAIDDKLRLLEAPEALGQ